MTVRTTFVLLMPEKRLPLHELVGLNNVQTTDLPREGGRERTPQIINENTMKIKTKTEK